MSIQGQLLDVTVVGCSKLKDTEWISRQDPYVFLEYATTKFRTRTCTDGGKHPTFQEKTVIPLIEGLREISVSIWNSNTITDDDFIGSGRIQLQKVLAHGYDDSSWALQSKSGKFAGEVKLIMHFAGAHQQHPGHNPHNVPESRYPVHPRMPTAPPPAAYYTQMQYPSMAAAYYAPDRSLHPPSSYPSSTNPSSTYPPATYPPANYGQATFMPASYPPAAYQTNVYPPQTYPPAPTNSYYPQGPYPAIYPPPPY
ncbi:hypothetical protein HPP92_015276 [Vanilla planifolia]|uniref:C2 domain-containing protein n=1 Tax=Vanilla planifolia TaxID=51239 RepID=A0A835QIV5_VANPL|nr:hypothetical protein HPP92_015276 [Vanilla planifolia]